MAQAKVLEKDLDQPIAYGKNSEIYNWSDDQVLKLYYINDRWSKESIEYEWRIAKAVYAAGLPVPSVGEMVHIDGRTGIIYERVVGTTMGDLIAHKWWNLVSYFRRFAELQFEMHSYSIDADLNDQKKMLEITINQSVALTDKLRQKALELLDSLPGGDRLCHGDFHPRNIIMTDHGETIIDWPKSTVGNPLADVARTSILTMGRIETHQFRIPVLKQAIHFLHNIYLKRYFTLNPGGEQEYARWLPVVTAARSRKKTPELEQWLTKEFDRNC